MLKQRNEVQLQTSSRRFVKVLPPTVHAGVGSALREAFTVDSELRSPKSLEQLLAKLN